MPTYVYRCDRCSASFEERRRFAEAEVPAACPVCEASATLVIGAPDVLIRGAANIAEREATSRRTSSFHAVGCPCCGPRRLIG